MQYRIIQDAVRDTCFFSFAFRDGLFVLVLNPDHPFYRKVYKPLSESDGKENKEPRSQRDLMLWRPPAQRQPPRAKNNGRRWHSTARPGATTSPPS